uniref:Uncharacterized protein n=1 Tax=Percolomonas cosmopolitus TaxID=63605 RepID=A0A7S1PFF5_9EUKA|eukprot:CAMPEP_0117438928 /NCGR_PEP_ID=MMETSP0759-20121206/2308_1 /TAXON_ID=63605 /ORGANISM="Percolomonas cosmopolitus, Strain WS" /LENGTH=1688 /DNA_ID=CAMNT_0005230639 /DNA_START=91 /DNA_END=5157 /DNA_ORIENTATION=+
MAWLFKKESAASSSSPSSSSYSSSPKQHDHDSSATDTIDEMTSGDSMGLKWTVPNYDTGKNVDSILEGLYQQMNDSSAEVKSQIRLSLEELGDKLPILTLCKGLQFLASTSRSTNKPHRVLTMNLMTHVLDSKDQLQIPKDVADALVKMSVSEIVAEKTISSEWQNSANLLLIAATRHNPQISARLLLENFPQGKIPHYFIIKALADFAHRYPKEFVPHLKDILSRTLPLLGMLKHDNLKWVFAAGLGRWSEAVVRVSEEFPDEEVDPRDYSASVRAALQHALQEWLLYKQSKVRLACAQGIGYMCYIIEPEELLKVLPKLIPDMIKLLKKEKADQLPVSIGMRHMTRAVMRDCPQQMEEHFDTFLTTIHGFIVSSNKNKKYEKWGENLEELCCAIHYTCNSPQYTDRVVTFLQKQIASNTSSIKVASLKLLNHLILNCDDALEPYKDQLVSALLLANSSKENSMSILSAFVDCVRSMAQFDYLKAQGGTDLVQVVITGSSISDAEIEEHKKKGKESKLITPETTREKCDHVLTEMTSGPYAPQMDDILWPFLMESLTPPQYVPAFVILCKCISDIAKRKKNDSNFIIDFDKEANLPKPDQLFARLIVMLSQPFERNESGINILRTLYCLSPNLNASLVEPWSKKLPLLKKEFLDAKNEDGSDSEFDQDKWENAILSLVRLSVDSVDDDQWNVSVGDAILKQAEPLYTNQPQLKRFLLTIMGLIIQKTNYKEFVIRAISGVFNNTNHKSESERLGCARGLGQASQAHTDTVLAKLARIMQSKEQKRSFFSKSTEPPVSAEAKATALLCYAYLCRLSPPELMKSRVDVHVIANIVPVLRAGGAGAQKLPYLLKKCGLTCLNFIGEAVTPERIPDFKLKARDELITVILEIIQPTPVKGKTSEEIMDQNHELTLQGLEALTTLINLPPKMAPEVQTATLKQLLQLLATNANGADAPAIPQEDVVEELHNVVAAILRADLSQSNLDAVLTHLERYMQSTSARARRGSTSTYVFVLKEFASGINENKPEADTLFNTGKMLGLLTPRLTEPVMDVRRNALDSIYLTLRIQHYISSPADSELPESIQRLISLRSRLDATEPDEKLQVTRDVVSIYSQCIDQSHLQDTLKTLMSTFNDVEEDAANGACFVFNGLVRHRGQELEKHVDQYVKMMVECMNRLSTRVQIVKGLLLSVRCLAKHYPLPVITSLLSYSVPHSKEVVNSFKELSKDKELLCIFFDHVIDMMNNSQLYDEKRGGANKGGSGVQLISVPEIDSATAALHEALSSSDCYAMMDAYYHQLVVAIVLRVGSSNAVSVNPPVADAQMCMRNLLKCARDEDILQKLEQDSSMDKLVGSEFPEGIQNILEMICKQHPEKIRPMFDLVKEYVKRTYLGQKIAATAAVSVLLNNIENDREMVNDAINCLLNRSGLDEPVIVKLYAIRGLAKVYKHPKEILHRFLTSIMTSLIAAVEDKDEGIILETMTAIRQLFSVADDEYASPHLLNLCIRLKPSFEKPNPQLRASSIHLFGTLARYAKGQQSDALLNKFHENLPTILLHLRDPEDEVIVACKTALIHIFPAFGKQKSSRIVGEVDVTKIRSAQNFEQFAKDFSVTWVEDFPERISEMSMNTVLFFDSQWPDLAAGACYLLGYMIAAMNDEQKQRINLRHNCGAIIKLLRSQHVQIREAAGKVLGLLDEA